MRQCEESEVRLRASRGIGRRGREGEGGQGEDCRLRYQDLWGGQPAT